MNNEIDLRASRSLALLGQLRQTVSHFEKSEEQIVRDLRAQRHALTRKQHDATNRMTGRFAAQTVELEAGYHREEQRIRALHDARAARIKRIESVALRKLPRLAREAKGNWLGSLQMRQLNADRTRATALEEADATAADFRSRLAAKGESLASLDDCASRFFGGYGVFQKLLGRRLDPASDGNTDGLYDELRKQVSVADQQLVAFRKFLLPRFFAAIPLAAILPFIIAGAAVATFALGIHTTLGLGAGVGGGVLLLAVVFGLHFAGKGKAAATDRKSTRLNSSHG